MRSSAPTRAGALGLACLALGCASPSGGGAPSGRPTTTSSSAPAPALEPEVARAIRRAEHRRKAGELPAELARSRDVATRRAVARALARIASAEAAARLGPMLDDEDPEVVRWAAYGLGHSCRGREAATQSALVARAAALTAREVEPEPLTLEALLRALGRCATDETEATLTSFLHASRPAALAASLALAELVMRRGRLREETLVSLLSVAAGSASAPPLAEALAPIARAAAVPASVKARLVEVASARSQDAGPHRALATRALGKAGDLAVPALEKVLLGATAGAGERVEAAKALGASEAGRKVVLAALAGRTPPSDPVAQTTLVSDDFAVTLALLGALPSTAEEPSKATRAALEPFTKVSAPSQAPLAVRRRLSLARCAAAERLVGERDDDARLTGCDLASDAKGFAAGARSVVEVLARAELVGPRLGRFVALAEQGPLVARARAIELLAEHPEVRGAARLLTLALTDTHAGVVAAAALVLAKHPERAAEEPPAPKKKKKKKKNEELSDPAPDGAQPPPSKALLAALGAALAKSSDPEVLVALADAAAALRLDGAVPSLEGLCKSPWPVLREAAQRALPHFGKKDVVCEAFDPGPDPDELGHLASGLVRVELDTDAGALSLELDAEAAPVAVTRVADLVRAGFYDGMVVHRVDGGFVAQLGSPSWDGMGGAPDKPSLRCETSPFAFDALSVGMALGGRDTGSSQLFVTLGPARHLDGGYAWLGRAKGPWASLAPGDVVTKARVASTP
jgi:cyclophilin family peptidyl-prolyl cis-trans isomerase